MKTAFMLDEKIFDKDTAVALGLFDGVHLGHQEVIRAAVSYKETGLAPCVFTFSVGNQTPDGKSGMSLLMSENERYELFAQMGVEYLLSPDFSEFMDISPEGFVKDVLVKILKAKVVCCGNNFHFGKNAAGGKMELGRLCQSEGIEARFLPDVSVGGETVSSTRIRRCVERGEIRVAWELLGRPFSFSQKVSEGNRLGNRMSFPTINQLFSNGHIIPKFGVYASMARVDGKLLPSVTNIGVKPTVGSDKPLAETHIMDFSADLYGRVVTIMLIEFIREEVKFASRDELIENIRRDARSARQICLGAGL